MPLNVLMRDQGNFAHLIKFIMKKHKIERGIINNPVTKDVNTFDNSLYLLNKS